MRKYACYRKQEIGECDVGIHQKIHSKLTMFPGVKRPYNSITMHTTECISFAAASILNGKYGTMGISLSSLPIPPKRETDKEQIQMLLKQIHPLSDSLRYTSAYQNGLEVILYHIN